MIFIYSKSKGKVLEAKWPQHALFLLGFCSITWLGISKLSRVLVYSHNKGAGITKPIDDKKNSWRMNWYKVHCSYATHLSPPLLFHGGVDDFFFPFASLGPCPEQQRCKYYSNYLSELHNTDFPITLSISNCQWCNRELCLEKGPEGATKTWQPAGRLKWRRKDVLTLSTLTSVCIFSILFSIHFQRCWQGELAWQSRASVIVDHFLYSHDLSMWFRDDVVRRN